jgi:hypothetical protein
MGDTFNWWFIKKQGYNIDFVFFSHIVKMAIKTMAATRVHQKSRATYVKAAMIAVLIAMSRVRVECRNFHTFLIAGVMAIWYHVA